MADYNQFGSSRPAQSGNPQHCAQCEAMLMDALDDTLSAADRATFDLHLVGCIACSAMFADAQRGSAWLEMLKTPRPEPSAALLDRIFAETCGAVTAGSTGKSAAEKSSTPYLVSPNTLLGRPIAAIPDGSTASNVLPFRNRVAASFNLRTIGQTLLQPRLAMTAAMAFFSIALTMNLTGIRLTEVHASDLRPSSLKRSISEANAHVVRYYDNLRVVYELESRVHDLQGDSESNKTATPLKSAPPNQDAKPSSIDQPADKPSQQEQDKESRPRPRPGSSHRDDLHPSLKYVTADARHNPAPGSDSESESKSKATQTLATLSPRNIPQSTTSPTNSPIDVKEWRLV